MNVRHWSRNRTRWAPALATLAFPALAAAQVPAGGEFQVNSYTTVQQRAPSAAMDATGNFVIAWETTQAPFFWVGIAGQRFAAGGARAGGEFQVSGAYEPYSLPDVAAGPRGDFLVTWLGWYTRPLLTRTVFARQFKSDGTPLGQPIPVAWPLDDSPSVAMRPDGGFVVAYHEYETYTSVNADVRAQRFDAAGARVGAEIAVNTYTTGHQKLPALAVDAAGNFLVVWQSAAQDGSGHGIFGQRFSASGAHVGGEFRVNAATAMDQTTPRVAANGAGFVVAWESDAGGTAGIDVHAQRLSAEGSAVGDEFVVNTYTTGAQSAPALASDVPGNFVVSWTSAGQDGSGDGIFAQRFGSSGARRGAEFRANTYTPGRQYASTIASDAQGSFVVAWSSAGQDGDTYGVFAQRFGGLEPAALAVDTAGNGVLEPGESADVRPSWRNRNGAAQTFAGTAVAFDGPSPATYTIEDGTGDYGAVPNGVMAACSDCYRVAVVTSTRPLAHWDAVLEEKITPDALGLDKRWRLHLGGSFADVPASSPFYRFVETLLHGAVTAGCGGTDYCPASSTTREQMAVFLLVSREGAGYRAPTCAAPMFADVPASSPFCPFIEELARRGVTSGCGGGNYCPGDPVSREQMAVFVLRTLDPALDPPACTTPVFADVPASSPFCRWIEELARRGVVTGCGGGNYCPAIPVTREQMAVFLGVTFGLALYGP